MVGQKQAAAVRAQEASLHLRCLMEHQACSIVTVYPLAAALTSSLGASKSVAAGLSMVAQLVECRLMRFWVLLVVHLVAEEASR